MFTNYSRWNYSIEGVNSYSVHGTDSAQEVQLCWYTSVTWFIQNTFSMLQNRTFNLNFNYIFYSSLTIRHKSTSKPVVLLVLCQVRFIAAENTSSTLCFVIWRMNTGETFSENKFQNKNKILKQNKDKIMTVQSENCDSSSRHVYSFRAWCQ